MLSIFNVKKQLETKVPANLKFWDKDGQVIEANEVVCTSSYNENNTINLLFTISRVSRTVRILSIFEFNGVEVCL